MERNQAVEHVPLGTAVSIEQLCLDLEQRGLLRGEQTSAAPLEGVPSNQQNPDQDPRSAPGVAHALAQPRTAPAMENEAAPSNPEQKQDPHQGTSKKRSGPAQSFTFPKVACPHWGADIAQNQLVKRPKACQQRATVDAPTPSTCPPSYGAALPPDHSFRDELLAALTPQAA